MTTVVRALRFQTLAAPLQGNPIAQADNPFCRSGILRQSLGSGTRSLPYVRPEPAIALALSAPPLPAAITNATKRDCPA